MFTRLKKVGLISLLFLTNLMGNELSNFKITSEGLYSLKDKKIINKNINIPEGTRWSYNISNLSGVGNILTYETISSSSNIQCYSPLHKKGSEYFIKNVVCISIYPDPTKNKPPYAYWGATSRDINPTLLSKIDPDDLFNKDMDNSLVIGKINENLMVFNKLPVINDYGIKTSENHIFTIDSYYEEMPLIHLSNLKSDCRINHNNINNK